MTPKPVTVGPADTLDRAIDLLDRHGFRHLPVVEGERVVGMISDRDLRLATGMLRSSRRIRDRKGRKVPGPERVSEVMHSPAFYMSPDTSPSEAAQAMVRHEIGAIPVVEEARLIGIVTETDLLQAFLELCQETDGKRDDLVRYHMHRPLTSVSPELSIEEALEALDRRVGHLAVMREEDLIGIVAERDLRIGLARAMIRDAQAESEGRMDDASSTVRHVMTHFVTTAEEDTTLSACARRMVENRISALPVIENRVLIGILTQRDVLQYFATVKVAPGLDGDHGAAGRRDGR
jgi:acetoin utilization protein AcuB